MDALLEKSAELELWHQGALFKRGAPLHPPGERRLAKNAWLTWSAQVGVSGDMKNQG